MVIVEIYLLVWRNNRDTRTASHYCSASQPNRGKEYNMTWFSFNTNFYRSHQATVCYGAHKHKHTHTHTHRHVLLLLQLGRGPARAVHPVQHPVLNMEERSATQHINTAAFLVHEPRGTSRTPRDGRTYTALHKKQVLRDSKPLSKLSNPSPLKGLF